MGQVRRPVFLLVPWLNEKGIDPGYIPDQINARQIDCLPVPQSLLPKTDHQPSRKSNVTLSALPEEGADVVGLKESNRQILCRFDVYPSAKMRGRAGLCSTRVNHARVVLTRRIRLVKPRHSEHGMSKGGHCAFAEGYPGT